MSLLTLLLAAQLQFSADQLLPANDWYSRATKARADAYYSCRRRNVEGVFPISSAAEGRAAVSSMLYDQRAECRRERGRLLQALDADVRRHRRSLGDGEYVLDVLERNIDAKMQTRFSWSEQAEQ